MASLFLQRERVRSSHRAARRLHALKQVRIAVDAADEIYFKRSPWQRT